MGYKAHWCWLFAFMDVLFILAISLTCFSVLLYQDCFFSSFQSLVTEFAGKDKG